MKTICALLAITAVVCGIAFAAETPRSTTSPAADANTSSKSTIFRQVQGVGPTRDEAIKNGLFQAVAQTRGIKVGSGDYSFGYRSASADVNRGGAGKQVEFDAVSVQTAGTLQTTDIAGLVKTYEVVDEKKIPDGNYQVTLKVWVYEHEPLGKSARLRLAVMPLRTESTEYAFLDLVMPADTLADKLAQRLTTALTATNKFAALDRQHIKEYLHEQNILFYSAPIEEQARIGESLGADLMLVGTIGEAGLRIKQTINPAIAHTFKEYRADFAFDYRLISAASREVKLSDSVRLRLETDDVKKLVSRWQPSDLDLTELIDNLIATAALEVADNISDKLYPPRIASINADGSVIIDQGGSRFAAGTLLDVVRPDKQITDSDTKETLGSTEILIATIRIDKVLPNISYGSVVSGEAAKLSQGLVCRPKAMPAEESQGAKSGIQTTPQGGVKLPFDK